MNLKSIFAKLQKGEEITVEEQEAIGKADDVAEVAEEEKKINELAEKILAKIDAGQKKEVIVDEKSITKEKIKEMSKEDRENAFFKSIFNKNDAEARMLQGIKSAYLNETADANGGFLVPDETSKEILNTIYNVSSLGSEARQIPNCPAHFDLTSLVTGPVAYWRAEAGVKRSSTLKFAQVALTPYSVAVIVPLTNELREDSMIDIGSFVTQAMTDAIADTEDDKFARGNGSGCPTGLEDYYAAYPAARKILDSNIGDLGDRCVAADTRLKMQYKKNAKFYMPTSQLEKVRLLRDAVGGGYLFQTDPTGEFAGRLLGKPVITNEYLTNVWFGDFHGYYIGRRGGLKVAMSDQATVNEINLWEQNMFAIRVEERVDGELVDNKAMIAIQAE